MTCKIQSLFFFNSVHQQIFAKEHNKKKTTLNQIFIFVTLMTFAKIGLYYLLYVLAFTDSEEVFFCNLLFWFSFLYTESKNIFSSRRSAELRVS